MPRPLGGGIKWLCCLTSDVCLTSVWRRLSRTSGLSREQRGLGKPIWHIGSPRHTWLGHHFQGQKVKGQGHQAALLTAVLVRQAAAAVGVGTCWPWETSATLPSARRWHIVAAARLQLVTNAIILRNSVGSNSQTENFGNWELLGF